MALPIKNTKTTEIAGLDTFYNGGKGSGNFGHSGRPGEVGGSGKGKQTSRKDEKQAKIDDLEKELDYLGETAEDLKSAIKRGEYGSEERLEDTEKKIKAVQKKLKEAGSGSSDQLSGPAKTHEEYTGKDASRDCKEEFSDTFIALSDHAYWIADRGELADGYDTVTYERFGDKYGKMGDRIPQARHTQQDLVAQMKRARKEAKEYAILDGSSSTDKLNEWLDKYDLDDKF